VDAKIRNDLAKVYHESERASKIVRNLLSFARPVEPLLASVHINDVITGVLDTFEPQLRSLNITTERRLQADLPRTKADAGQLEQVFTNLISNAIQAMGQESGHRYLTIATMRINERIRFTVSDTGSGIPDHLIGRVFDPFFTTKSPGKGTGLGLALSHTIIKEHGGQIWVESQVGRGTTFFIELPIVACHDETPAPLAAPDAHASPLPCAMYRLLIVDDEPGIVDVLQAILSDKGYVIDTATNGQEAIRLLDTNQYDLIISDLRMPELDGERLHAAIRGRDPGLASRIIFITGDTVSQDARDFLEGTGNRWLNKPFDIRDVENAVRECLEGFTQAQGDGPALANATALKT
jgi:two-component system NtrC family sensor kinase